MKKTFLSLLAFAMVLLPMAGCHGHTQESDTGKPPAQHAPDTREARFPIPVIPDFITGKEERVAYALEHYWQAYDFNDTTQANRDRGEQGFSNFLLLLQHADSATAARSVRRYLEKGFAQPSLRALHNGMIRHYLDNPNSPLRNDVLYVHFLRAQLNLYGPDEVAERERCAFLLRMVSLNQPGTIAADFRFTDRNGKKGRLHAIKSPLTLLLFNDPDCENCQKEMPRLIASPLLQSPGLAVVAVYPDSDTEIWKNAQSRMPATWTDAYSPDGEVVSRTIYYLPAMPSLYLLDADKRILLKDATPESVLQYIANHLKAPAPTSAP